MQKDTLTHSEQIQRILGITEKLSPDDLYDLMKALSTRWMDRLQAHQHEKKVKAEKPKS